MPNLASWQGGPRRRLRRGGGRDGCASGVAVFDCSGRSRSSESRVYLYYRPIASYLETRNDLATSRADVESLRLVKAELELRLVNSTSVDSIEREARRIGYVKPGERLFVVKGIPAWRKARSSGDGVRP